LKDGGKKGGWKGRGRSWDEEDVRGGGQREDIKYV